MKSQHLDGLLEEMVKIEKEVERKRLATLYALSSIDASKLSEDEKITHSHLLRESLPKFNLFEIVEPVFESPSPKDFRISSATMDAVLDYASKKHYNEMSSELEAENIAKYMRGE